jgi:hypothetical protein
VVYSALAPASTEGIEQKEYDWDSPKMKELMAFLEKDLVHLFDEQGIDKNMYDQKVDFKDPITKYDSLNGYLFNIFFLRKVLTPKFELHSIKQVCYLKPLLRLFPLHSRSLLILPQQSSIPVENVFLCLSS